MPGTVVSQLRSNERQEVVAILVHQVPRRDFSAYVKAAEGRARIINSADRHNHGGHTRNGVPFELQLCDPWIFRMSDRHLADAGARYLAYRPPIRPVPQENRQEVEPTRRVRRPEPERNRDTRRLNVLTVAQNRPVRLNIPRVLCDLRLIWSESDPKPKTTPDEVVTRMLAKAEASRGYSRAMRTPSARLLEFTPEERSASDTTQVSIQLRQKAPATEGSVRWLRDTRPCRETSTRKPILGAT